MKNKSELIKLNELNECLEYSNLSLNVLKLDLKEIEFRDNDLFKAEMIAKKLGYTQTAYTSSSALIGLFCLKDKAGDKAGCIIKTEELGFLFVADGEDLNLGYMFEDVKEVE